MQVKGTERFSVYSPRTKKTYVVEPTNVSGAKTVWGNVNTSTGKIEIVKAKEIQDEQDSIITEENGFMNIVMLPQGESPMSYIEKIDLTYPSK